MISTHRLRESATQLAAEIAHEDGGSVDRSNQLMERYSEMDTVDRIYIDGYVKGHYDATKDQPIMPPCVRRSARSEQAVQDRKTLLWIVALLLGFGLLAEAATQATGAGRQLREESTAPETGSANWQWRAEVASGDR